MSTHTKILFSGDARQKLYKGLNLAAEAVGCTLGPKGKLVLLQQDENRPIVTKDGVTVAKSINLKDPVERMGAQMILEAANHTNDVAGDGTTTATVLTHAMVREGLKLVTAGFSPQEVCAGIALGQKRITDMLAKMSVKLESSKEVEQIGTVSANGDQKIGGLIAEAMEKVGRDGIITVEDAKGMLTSLEVVEGMQLDRGYLSPYFVTNAEKMIAAFDGKVFVMVTDKKITALREIVPVLEALVKANGSLVIIADDVEGEALQGLILNRVKAGLRVVAIKAPGYGNSRTELLGDICALTGASLISATTGLTLEKAQLTDLGHCKRIVVDAKSTILVGDGSTKANVDKHVTDLKERSRDVTLSKNDLGGLHSRIAKLSSGVAVIKVGGATEIEMIERKHRIEDALNATKAAVEEGILPGGGYALFSAAEELSKNTSELTELAHGLQVVASACQEPLKRIVKNAGKSPEVIAEALRSGKPGYNAATGEFVDLSSIGIIDPHKVTRCALEHAASVAMTFLSLDAVIVDDEDKKPVVVQDE